MISYDKEKHDENHRVTQSKTICKSVGITFGTSSTAAGNAAPCRSRHPTVMNPLCVLLGGFLHLPNCLPPQPGPQIMTSLGPVEGSTFPGVDGSPIRAFRGLPYGRVEARGQPSVPIPPWSATRSAVRPAPPCPAGTNTAMREDCLILNVYLPAGRLNTSQLLPALIVLLSDELVPPSPSSPSPSALLASSLVPKGIALVTVQYRTGVFGFLNSESPNTGLFDVLNALRFIQENSVAFGLDSTRFVLAGVGEGAQVASVLSLSPATKGQLSGLILLSGSSWSLGGQPDPSDEFFSKINCGNLTDSACFRRMSLESVEEASYGLKFHPTVGEMLVPSEPSVLLDSRHKFPTLIMISDYPDVEVTADEFNVYVSTLAKRFGSNRKAEERIRLFYYPLEQELIEEEFADLKGDVSYRIPAVLEAKARSLYAPVFLSKLDNFNELMLLLETGENPQKQLLTDSIVQFTKTGNPSTNSQLWPVFDSKGEYLHISNESAYIGKDLLQEEVNFWNELAHETGRDFFTGENLPSSAGGLCTFVFIIIIFTFP